MIKAIDAEQGGPPPEPSGVVAPERPQTAPEESNPQFTDTPLLSAEEKRRILARIARVNPLDCFDESGAFDMARAKRILPPCSIRHIALYETTRVSSEALREGGPSSEASCEGGIAQRRVHLRLVDPLSALRLDDLLEKRRESTASPNDPPKNFDPNSRRVFNLLREMTIGRDDALATIERLKKDLARTNKELDEKIHQLELAQRLRELTPSADASLSTPAPKALNNVEGLQTHEQCETGCQPVGGMAQTRQAGFATPLAEQSKAQDSTTLAEVGSPSVDISGNPCSSVSGIPQVLSTETLSPSNGAAQRETDGQPVQEKLQATIDHPSINSISQDSPSTPRRRRSPPLDHEMEHMRNTSGDLGFHTWLRIHRPAEWVKLPHPPPSYTPRQKTSASQPARPPPRH